MHFVAVSFIASPNSRSRYVMPRVEALRTILLGGCVTAGLKSVRKGRGLGLNPPLSLIFYKNFVTRAKEID